MAGLTCDKMRCGSFLGKGKGIAQRVRRRWPARARIGLAAHHIRAAMLCSSSPTAFA
jgi:hypothetical protein